MSSRIRASAASGSRIAFRRAAAASRWKLASLICATSSEPLGGSLAEQNEKFDVVSRRFRGYSDGRVTRRERMED